MVGVIKDLPCLRKYPSALEGIQLGQNSLNGVDLNETIALYFLLARQCRGWVILNTFLCTWLNSSSQVERSIWKSKGETTWLSARHLNGSWRYGMIEVNSACQPYLPAWNLAGNKLN